MKTRTNQTNDRRQQGLKVRTSLKVGPHQFGDQGGGIGSGPNMATSAAVFSQISGTASTFSYP